MKQLLFLSAFLFTQALFAQINVGTVRQTETKAGEFEGDALQTLKNATTLFILRPMDEPKRKEIQAILEDAWTYNDIKVIGRAELQEYYEEDEEDKYAYMAMEGHAEPIKATTTSYLAVHYYIHLNMRGKEIPYSNKELREMKRFGEKPTKRYDIKTFARMELYPDGEVTKLFSDFWSNYRNKLNLTDDEKNEHMNYMYEEAGIHNWHWGYIKNMVQEVNRLLEKGETRWLFESDEKESELKKLRQETLYIPDHVLIYFNKSNRTEEGRHEEKELFKHYDYNYELLSAEALNEKILTTEQPFYYFNYIRSYTNAFFTITNALTGEIIYSDHDPVTFNMVPRDFRLLNNDIKRAK